MKAFCVLLRAHLITASAIPVTFRFPVLSYHEWVHWEKNITLLLSHYGKQFQFLYTVVRSFSQCLHLSFLLPPFSLSLSLSFSLSLTFSHSLALALSLSLSRSLSLFLSLFLSFYLSLSISLPPSLPLSSSNPSHPY